MLACAIAGTLMFMVPPVVAKQSSTRSSPGIIPSFCFRWCWSLRLRSSCSDGLNSLRLLLNNTFEQKVIFDLRSDLYSHIQLLPLRWFDNRATGDLMTRVLEDVTSVERVLIDGMDQGTVAVLTNPALCSVECFT